MFDLNAHNGATLAYVGDAVIELYLRGALLSLGFTDTGKLSAMAQKLVCAPMQSDLMESLLPMLTPEEEAIYRLGRNYRTHAKPKHATPAQYSRATGMEAVFGYLHLTGQTERATQLLSEIYDEKIAQFQDIH
jgi:ribonuclease-3 family protein